MIRKWLIGCAAVLLIAGCSGSPEEDQASEGSGYDGIDMGDDATAGAAVPKQGMHNGEWLAYGADKASTKYSALEQINADNVANLEVAWEWTSVDAALMEENKRLVPFINEVTPIVVNGVMYASTSFSQVAAINPVTGETIWSFDTGSSKAGRPTNLGFVHRGVAYWSEGDDERVYIGTGDMNLWCLDAKTGKPHAEFNGGEAIDMAENMRRPVNRKNMAISSPPVICNGVIVVGSSIFDGPTLKEMPPGDVRAFDVKTGEAKWTFFNPPLKGTEGHDTWKDGSAEYTGNGNVWTGMSADEDLGYVYLPFGTPTNDWYGGHRKGNNLFAETIVCVEAATGKKVWHFQTTHHGLWDYDLPAAPTLLDVTVDGKAIPALAQVTKHGFVFVLNRATGEPVWPIEERDVPQSTTPGEETSPTQPFPTKPAPYERQGSFEEDLIDFTPELRAAALEIFNKFNTGPIYTPPSPDRATIYMPGWGGGANWMGCAADPETGWIYIPSMTGPISVTLQKPDPARSNFMYMGGNTSVAGPKGLPLFKPPYGRITAINLNTGEHEWMVPHGDGPRNHPEIKDLNLPALGNSSRGHPLITKSLLMIAEAGFGRGSSGGGADKNFRAYNKTDGSLVAELTVPGGPSGTPMTYMIDGKQYITVPVGGLRAPSKLVTLALP